MIVPATAATFRPIPSSLLLAWTFTFVVLKSLADTSARADTPQPRTSRETMPQKLRGNDAKSTVGRIATSVPIYAHDFVST